MKSTTKTLKTYHVVSKINLNDLNKEKEKKIVYSRRKCMPWNKSKKLIRKSI